MIRAAAVANGIDPSVAIAVANSEGLHRYVGDYGTSFGPFWLHYGGGLGDVFSHLTGLDARDPKSLAAQIAFAMRWASEHGWGDWHGAANTGISRWKGISHVKPPPSNQKREVTVPIELKVDGKVLAKTVTTRQTKMAEMPLGVHGAPDSYASFVGPGTTFQNA